jgi:acetyl esterase/lipase
MRLILLMVTAIVIFPSCTTAKNFWSHKYSVNRNIAYGDLPRQKLDIYIQGEWTGPPNYFVSDTSLHPTVLYIHGGAWHSGNKDDSEWSVMPFIERGWQAINIEYTVGSNTAPQAAEDVFLALIWTIKNAAKYGIDTNKIVIAGDSAGGHLALYLGLATTNKAHEKYLDKQLNIAAIINWFGISDIKLLDEYLEKNGKWNYPKLWVGTDSTASAMSEELSPVHLVSELSPPVYTVHGKADTVVPIDQASSLHQKLNEFSVDNKLLSLSNAGHFRFSESQWQLAYSEMFAFLNTQVPKDTKSN